MMATDKKVLICILTYNDCMNTLDCLQSIESLTYNQSARRTVVVDNGSSDNTAKMIPERYPGVVFIRKETNTGAAAGRNAGIDYALQQGYDYIFFVDNDAVVEPSTLTELVAAAERDPLLAAVGAMTYYFKDRKRIWNFGGIVNWSKGRFCENEQGVIDAGQFTDVKAAHSFPIGFGIVRVDAIRAVGLIDERYFIYYEEADWHARMMRAGWRLAVTPRAKMYHNRSSSLGMESPVFYYYRTRNRLLYMRKNAPRLVPFFFYFLYDFSWHTLLTLYLSKKPAQIRAALLGVSDFMRGRFGKCGYDFTAAAPKG